VGTDPIAEAESLGDDLEDAIVVRRLVECRPDPARLGLAQLTALPSARTFVGLVGMTSCLGSILTAKVSIPPSTEGS